jgi:tetratricopeptide (TPR) repeat protein
MKLWTTLAIILFSAVTALATVSDEDTLKAVESFMAGQTALQQKDFDTAIPALEKALSFNPELYMAQLYLGQAYLAKKDTAKGLEHLKIFVDKVGNDPAMAAQVGQARGQILQLLLQEKNWPEAIPMLEERVKAQPDNVQLRKILTQGYMKTDQMPKVEEQLVKIAEISPADSNFLFKAAQMAYARKDDATAKPRLEAFVAKNPNAEEAGQAYLWLGQIAERAEDWDAAKGYYEQYMATNPTGAAADAVKQNLENWDAIVESKKKAAEEGEQPEEEAAPTDE